MRKATRLFFILTASLSSLQALAAPTGADFEMIADYGGKIAAWRFIPGTLFARCSKELPQNEQAMSSVYTFWIQTNDSLILRIDKIIDRISPAFSKTMNVDDSEAKRYLIDFITTEIADTYFNNQKISATQVCADYEKIIAGLSSPGRLATIRGLMYAIEGLVATEVGK